MKGIISKNVRYNDQHDILEVYGVKYSGVVFRQLGVFLKPGSWFRLVAREDGVLTVETKGEGE